jgi:hypothetical protein
MKRIITKAQLAELAKELNIQPDWHEPDEQEVTAVVRGERFDNAGFWGEARLTGRTYEEISVILRHDGEPVAAVNLATLFAWATGLED